MKDNNEILELADEIAAELQQHPLAKEFEKCQSVLKNDMDAQRLMSELIAMGESLSEKGNRGEPVTAEKNAENMLLQQRLEKNETVKNFIKAQKDYLNLIQAVRKAYTDPLVSENNGDDKKRND